MNKNNIKKRNSTIFNLSTRKNYKYFTKNIFDIGGPVRPAPLQSLNTPISGASKISTMSPEIASAAGLTPKREGIINPNTSNTSKTSSVSASGIASGIVGALGGAASILDSTMQNAQIANTTNIEQSINELSNTKFNDYNTDSLLDQYNNLNYAKTDYTGEDIRGLSNEQAAMNVLSATTSGASAGGAAGGWGALAGGLVGFGSSLAGYFMGNKKAREQAEKLNVQAELANRSAQQRFNNTVDIMNENMATNALKAAYAKDGGAIHIKKNNKGKFTSSAKRAEMGVQEFARHVLANKNDYSSTLVKRANFARNANKWKHSLGGYMFEDGGNLYSDIPAYQTHGGNFFNGVTVVGAGGTHEDNPHEGVPMGIAPDGQPNLVEEGEIIFNDYVFSNRLHPSDKQLKESRLPNKYNGYTFALIAENMSKESSERPNDPISQRGLQDSLRKLALLQEQQRMKKGKKGTQQMMAFGGRKYSGKDDVNFINYDDPFIRSLDQAIENAELNYYASKSPEIQEGLSKIRKANTFKPLSTFLRYAPVVGSTIGALQSVFQKPDYSNSDLILNTINNLSKDKVSPRLLYNKLTYNPLDRNYYLNQLKSQAGATRQALLNSGNNAGNIMAGLLAANYNTQNAVGDTLMKMDMYNKQQRQAVEQFNRETNQYNSQAAMNAAAQNAQLAQARDNMRLSGTATAANMRELADTALATSRSANFTNLFNNLGAIGRENRDTNMLQSMIDSDLFGTLSESMNKGWRKNGGMLTKRNRRRK